MGFVDGKKQNVSDITRLLLNIQLQWLTSLFLLLLTEGQIPVATIQIWVPEAWN